MRHESAPRIAPCGVAVMAKASHPGRTKTRLSPPLTLAEAAAFNTAFLKDIAENLIAAASAGGLQGYMAYGPPGSEAFFHQHLPEEIGLIEAWAPNFGECLAIALQGQFDKGHEAACVLNSDSPTLPVSLLVKAASILAEPGERAVLGPSADGGYYLLGVKTLHPRLFEDIAWSTAAVAAQTAERAREIGLPLVMLPEWYDVDDAGALSILAGEVLYGKAFAPGRLVSSPARCSASLLSLMAQDRETARRLGLASREAIKAAS